MSGLARMGVSCAFLVGFRRPRENDEIIENAIIAQCEFPLASQVDAWAVWVGDGCAIDGPQTEGTKRKTPNETDFVFHISMI